jgi:hypothetical protein
LRRGIVKENLVGALIKPGAEAIAGSPQLLYEPVAAPVRSATQVTLAGSACQDALVPTMYWLPLNARQARPPTALACKIGRSDTVACVIGKPPLCVRLYSVCTVQTVLPGDGHNSPAIVCGTSVPWLADTKSAQP